jgi:hypothetical protein
MLRSIFSPENVSLFREREKVFLFIIAHSAELTHQLLKCTRTLTSSKKIVERQQLSLARACRSFFSTARAALT